MVYLLYCTYVVKCRKVESDMQINERIKRVREYRKITQKELGLALGGTEKSAAVRIGQYETGARIPKKESAIALSKALNCNYINFYNGSDLSEAERIMMDFFWLEETMTGSLYIFQLQRYNDKSDIRIAHGMFNDYQYDGVFPPVALALNYNKINDFMREWAYHFNERQKKEISADEYFEWKLNWPFTCDDGGRFEPSIQWRK